MGDEDAGLGPWHEALAVLASERHRGVLDDAAAILDAERSLRTLAAGLRAGGEVTARLAGGWQASGTVAWAGDDAALLVGTRRQLVRIPAILACRGCADALPTAGEPDDATFRGALPAWAGQPVAAWLVDGSVEAGELASAGRDHLVLGRIAVPFAAIAALVPGG